MGGRGKLLHWLLILVGLVGAYKAIVSSITYKKQRDHLQAISNKLSGGEAFEVKDRSQANIMSLATKGRVHGWQMWIPDGKYEFRYLLAPVNEKGEPDLLKVEKRRLFGFYEYSDGNLVLHLKWSPSEAQEGATHIVEKMSNGGQSGVTSFSAPFSFQKAELQTLQTEGAELFNESVVIMSAIEIVKSEDRVERMGAFFILEKLP